MNTYRPLYITVLEVGSIWAVANIAYFTILPLLGIDLSYVSAPYAMAAYFLIWLGISAFTFRDLFRDYLPLDTHISTYGIASLVYGLLVFAGLYVLSLVPITDGQSLVPYSDIVFATPYYFIPKAVEVLLQQSLIGALVIALYRTAKSLRTTIVWYAILFGGTHALMYMMSYAPNSYGMIMTIGAICSSLVFPYLILRVKSGFLHSYALHIAFYIVVALILHTWPPPGYM